VQQIEASVRPDDSLAGLGPRCAKSQKLLEGLELGNDAVS